MYDVLTRIIANKKKEVAIYKGIVSQKQLESELENCHLPIYSLQEALLESTTGIIAEFKRKSPSKGWINKKADAKDVVKKYKYGGAAAVSVLTDGHFFGGLMADLSTAASILEIPVLRKDFIVDEYQILQARLLGASAILLIAAALTKEEVNRFTNIAHELNLDVLLELHDESEIDYITTDHNIIGINNRNLGTFDIDIDKSFQMIRLLPTEAIWVAESGISDPSTVVDLRDAGYRGFLIGENFMKSDDEGICLAKFIRYIESR